MKKLLLGLLFALSLVYTSCGGNDDITSDNVTPSEETFTLILEEFYGRKNDTNNIQPDLTKFKPTFPKNFTVLFYAAESKGNVKYGDFVAKKEMKLGVNTFEGLPAMKYHIYSTNYYQADKKMEDWVTIRNPMDETFPIASTELYLFGVANDVDYSNSVTASIVMETIYDCVQIGKSQFIDRPFVVEYTNDGVPIEMYFEDTMYDTYFLYVKSGIYIKVPTRTTQQGTYSYKEFKSMGGRGYMLLSEFNNTASGSEFNPYFTHKYFPLSMYK